MAKLVLNCPFLFLPISHQTFKFSEEKSKLETFLSGVSFRADRFPMRGWKLSEVHHATLESLELYTPQSCAQSIPPYHTKEEEVYPSSVSLLFSVVFWKLTRCDVRNQSRHFYSVEPTIQYHTILYMFPTIQYCCVFITINYTISTLEAFRKTIWQLFEDTYQTHFVSNKMENQTISLHYIMNGVLHSVRNIHITDVITQDLRNKDNPKKEDSYRTS